MNPIIEELNNEQMKTDLPTFASGDTVVIQVKVKEGSRERLQAYEGVVIAKSNRGLHSSFIVRKISHGVGVERTFQLHSPLIESIDIISAKKSFFKEGCDSLFSAYKFKK